MVTPSPASIVVMPFPFSDLSSTKLRPAHEVIYGKSELMVKRVAVVNDEKFTEVLDALISHLQANRPE